VIPRRKSHAAPLEVNAFAALRRLGGAPPLRLPRAAKRAKKGIADAAHGGAAAPREERMQDKIRNGSALAIAAVSLALAGAVTTTAQAATPGRVQCLGANACQGKGDCHSPKNACKGMNACKGKGWIHTESAEACKEAGGKTLD
jgi:hypothetical protein